MIAAMLLVLGGAFMLLAAVGLLRLPDLFLRMSATAPFSRGRS
jgi:multisubunit Na+/H+ antiporter MnhG subunit